MVVAATHDGRRWKILTLLDEYPREGLALRVERRLGSNEVSATLAAAMTTQGSPEHLRSDNGPAFMARALRAWLHQVGAAPLSIEPGSPGENGYGESFNGQRRDESLNRELCYSLREAQLRFAQWRSESHTRRPHAALADRPPAPQTWPLPQPSTFASACCLMITLTSLATKNRSPQGCARKESCGSKRH